MCAGFPSRPRSFTDPQIKRRNGAWQQPRAIEEKRVVAGRQIGELQARRTARGLRRDEVHPAINRYPACAVAGFQRPACVLHHARVAAGARRRRIRRIGHRPKDQRAVRKDRAVALADRIPVDAVVAGATTGADRHFRRRPRPRGGGCEPQRQKDSKEDEVTWHAPTGLGWLIISGKSVYFRAMTSNPPIY
jgi:hypothetical protein